MRAILLAAGFGTRLRPLTNKIQKCLVAYNSRPLLDIWLYRLSSYGVGPFLVNTHYMSHQVEQYISLSCYRDQVTLSYESELLGTAATLISNIDFFQNSDGMLIHADNYCITDFNEFIEAHKNRPKRCLMTMMTFRTDDPLSCGIVKLDNEGVIVDFYEKSSSMHGNIANGAVYILSRDFMKIIKSNFKNAIDFSTDIIPNFIGQIYTYENKDYHRDIGTIESYNLSVQYHNSVSTK
jgi:mannose-1-phosphate guanylyltransferase